MNVDTMLIEIMSDGTIKTTTDPISGANHANAAEFLKQVARLAGTDAVVVKRHDPRHHHGHTHTHTHTKA